MQRKPRSLAVTAWMILAVMGSVWAQDPTKDVINLDFTNAATADQVQLNEAAKFVVEEGKQRLRLTDDFNQAASAFVKTPVTGANYLATFDFEVRRVNEGEDPADGFVFVAQTKGPDAVGGLGFDLGYGGPNLRGVYSYGIEFNTYAPQGLPDSPETVALDLFGARTRLSQTAFPHIDGGMFRAQVRVTPERVTVTLSGGTANMEPKVILTSPEWLPAIFDPKQPTYFGFTGGTGGLEQITDIYNLRVQVP